MVTKRGLHNFAFSNFTIEQDELSKQLSELRESVKVQAKQALESSVRQVAEQIGLASAVTPEQTDVATTSTVAKPEAQAKAE